MICHLRSLFALGGLGDPIPPNALFDALNGGNGGWMGRVKHRLVPDLADKSARAARALLLRS